MLKGVAYKPKILEGQYSFDQIFDVFPNHDFQELYEYEKKFV